MSQSNINELALAREMQLIFNHTRGFTPIGEGMNRWQGTIEVESPSGKIDVPVEVMIPLKFPQYPPRVIVKDKDIIHPNVEQNGNILLRITHEWKPDTHVYQVIHAVKDLFSKVPPKTSTRGQTAQRKATIQSTNLMHTPKRREVDNIGESITSLQDKIKAKDEELRGLRAQLVKSSSESVEKIEDLDMLLPSDKKTREKLLLQAQNVALADLLSTLDEKFKDGEISPVDFAKLYRRYSKEFYIVNKKLEKL